MVRPKMKHIKKESQLILLLTGKSLKKLKGSQVKYVKGPTLVSSATAYMIIVVIQVLKGSIYILKTKSEIA